MCAFGSRAGIWARCVCAFVVLGLGTATSVLARGSRWVSAVNTLSKLGPELAPGKEASALRAAVVTQLKADEWQLEVAEAVGVVPLLSDAVVATPRPGSEAARRSRWAELVPLAMGQTVPQHVALLERLRAARRAVRYRAGESSTLSVPEPTHVGFRDDDDGPGSASEIIIYEQFLSEAEVDALAALGLQLVADKQASATDKKIAYMDRITMSKHKKAKADPIYQTVEARIAALTGIRQHKDEAAYFVAQRPHKGMGQPHHDQNHRPMRWWTVLMYLSDQPGTSGNTAFPCFDHQDGASADQELCRTLMRGYDAGWRSIDAGAKAKFGWNTTAYGQLKGACSAARPNMVRVAPRRGTAVVFPSARSDGTPIRAAWHSACVVLDGAPLKLTLQFFKEFPRDALPPLLQANETLRELAAHDRDRKDI